MLRLALALALVGFVLPAFGHDIYSDFWSGGERGVGRWCCTGNEEGTAGDCSPAEATMNRDGSAYFVSRRYPTARVLVPAHRILWMVIPGGEKYEAHLCAVPRNASSPPPDEDNPDPAYFVYCAAMNPGGV